MKKIKILELFGGIGACTKALTRLGFEVDVVDYVDNDKYAVASYNAINNTNFKPQDITCYYIDCDIKQHFGEVDLIMHGSPCQDFSIAGKQAGGDINSGTRSSLMYETLRIVAQLNPKYVIWENVKNLLSAKHKHNFESYIEYMDRLGYNSYYQVLNAKDYGIPQNRERVFTVSIREDIDSGYEFPEKRPLEIRLKDLLDKEVDEKFYISDKQIEKIKSSKFMQEKTRIQEKDVCDTLLARDYKDPKCIQVGTLDMKGHDCLKRVYSGEGLRSTLTTMGGGDTEPKIIVKNATKKGYAEAFEGDSINLAYPQSKTRRGRIGKQLSQTLTTNDNMGVVVSQRIRKLTPKECWRLMGFDDEDFERAEKVCSNTQLYKQAGNSIVVNVLEVILDKLLHKRD